ncbi:hypothetical protein QAD02_018069 [Eretmocerus hayati]|uniref:Uncharacterized protein n=1 Tax=Eretmocerus hayati TaxID=131215 RepID=A0ACC2PFM8_9HYME|nr:hypothetical protein QAD02_018069 [Eretmocerus hayati]
MLQEVTDDSDGCGAKFSVIIVSDKFEGKPLLQRHRLVNDALAEELKEIHAFSQKTLTPEQWKQHISAPGKVILFGEHAVVYGKTAVAASLNLRTTLYLNEIQPDNNSAIILELPKVNLIKSIPLNLLLDQTTPKLSTEGHESLYKHVQKLASTIGIEDNRQKISLECILYAIIQVVQEEGLEPKACKLKLDSELSIGAGAGSSASFAVCLVAAFLRWSQLQKNPNAPIKFDKDSLEKISKFAFNCEKIMHGTPSGIDNSICTFGSIIEFRRGEQPSFIDMGSKSLQVLLVDTCVGRNTKQLVDKVAALMAKFPDVIHPIMQSIDAVSKKAIEIFKDMQNVGTDVTRQQNFHENLADLVRINHGLLNACQVSHSSLEAIVDSAKKHQFSGKLTGAGGGGFAYILIPPNASQDVITNLIRELSESGFKVCVTDLGGPGVRVH